MGRRYRPPLAVESFFFIQWLLYNKAYKIRCWPLAWPVETSKLTNTLKSKLIENRTFPQFFIYSPFKLCIIKLYLCPCVSKNKDPQKFSLFLILIICDIQQLLICKIIQYTNTILQFMHSWKLRSKSHLLIFSRTGGD